MEILNSYAIAPGLHFKAAIRGECVVTVDELEEFINEQVSRFFMCEFIGDMLQDMITGVQLTTCLRVDCEDFERSLLEGYTERNPEERKNVDYGIFDFFSVEDLSRLLGYDFTEDDFMQTGKTYSYHFRVMVQKDLRLGLLKELRARGKNEIKFGFTAFGN